MNSSASVTPIDNSSARSQPLILESLADPHIADKSVPRRARLQIDLMLLALEALEVGGSEEMLRVAQQLELDEIIKNRVQLWRLRSTNPIRRAHARRPLKLEEAKALVAIACHLAKRLTVTNRELLLISQKLNEKQLPWESNFRLSEYLERFRAHFRSRMNSRRAMVAAYSTNDKLNALAMSLLSQLLFCTGTLGMSRWWSSLFDGEVE
jgi:hypothetical protein